MKMTLQQEWDYFLVVNFYVRPNWTLGWVLQDFCKRKGVQFDDVFALERSPTRRKEHGMTVTRFVCGHVVGGADLLYSHTKAEAFKVAKAFGRLRYTRTPVDAVKVRVECDARRASKKEDVSARASHEAHVAKNEAHRRNWGVCK